MDRSASIRELRNQVSAVVRRVEAGELDRSVSIRELRNQVSAVVRRVEAGETVTVTVDRRPVAELAPLRSVRRVSIGDALAVVRHDPADRGLLADLRAGLLDTTDDL